MSMVSQTVLIRGINTKHIFKLNISKNLYNENMSKL